MSTYVFGDIHNSLRQLERILNRIAPTMRDTLYFLGDLFDRGCEKPDPVGVYFRLKGLNSRCVWICGNHDRLLAEYIYQYMNLSDKRRRGFPPYRYNSFDLMRERLTEVDLLDLADIIMALPLQKELVIGSKRYLLAHAMTFDTIEGIKDADAYTQGTDGINNYFENGVEGYISIVGHTDSGYLRGKDFGTYMSRELPAVWKNSKGNLYLLDCGCGLPGGKLACICLETGEIYYA